MHGDEEVQPAHFFAKPLHLVRFWHCLCNSTIRQAMVGIMLDTTLQHERRHHQVQPDLGEDNALARNAGRVVERTREGVRRAATGNRTSSESSSTCLMWCAIALGALVRGAPNEYVSLESPLSTSFANGFVLAWNTFVV